MQTASVLSGWDIALLIVPFAALMVMAMFGLDERLASPSGGRSRNRRFCSIDRDGQPVLLDPDGRRCHPAKGDSRKSQPAKAPFEVLQLECETRSVNR